MPGCETSFGSIGSEYVRIHIQSTDTTNLPTKLDDFSYCFGITKFLRGVPLQIELRLSPRNRVPSKTCLRSAAFNPVTLYDLAQNDGRRRLLFFTGHREQYALD